jgi:nicotinate phosphoribosyltransferase
MKPASEGRALLTDFYELIMAAGYFEHKLEARATFELFIRSLPPERTYLVACGLEAAIEYLESLRFTKEDIAFLRRQSAFRTVSGAFFDYLRDFRFTGDVNAVREGTVIFAEEPVLQITAPIVEAQIVETYLLSVINFETLVATKSSRVVHAAQGKGVLEFGTRRAQGPEAGLRAARAAYIGGCIATSNVLAGFRYGVPLAGTVAHSWTQAFSTERESFEAILETFPEHAFLLIDTYEPLAGAELASSLGRRLPGVRLDSGNLLDESRAVRKLLDLHGLAETKIVASGDLNEYKIAELMAAGAPVDFFGVGTEIATSRDVPSLSAVYKLVELEEHGRLHYKTKYSKHKGYAPGRKQVFRFEENGRFHHDLISRADENYPDAVPLLDPVMMKGKRVAPQPVIEDIRSYAQRQLTKLPEESKVLHDAVTYDVRKSTPLEHLHDQLREGDLAGLKEAAADRR